MNDRAGRSGNFRTLFPFLIATAVFLGVATLYATGYRSAYHALVHGWVVFDNDWPFLDASGVLGAAECARAGLDVFASNNPDACGGQFVYTPLWLMLALLPVSKAWVVPTGLGLAMAYLGSILLLPPSRTWRGALVITGGLLSSASAFALERGNADIILFALSALIATLAARSFGFRLVAYGLALLAGLLKFFPMSLLAIAARERLAVFAAVAAVAAALTGLFVLFTWHDFVRSLTVLPLSLGVDTLEISHTFGAQVLSEGIWRYLELPVYARRAIRLALTLGAFVAALYWARRGDTGEALARLGERERLFLLTGSLLILSCFFTAQVWLYHAIHLILALPALAAMGCASFAHRFRLAAPVALLLMWSLFWYDVVAKLDALVRPHGVTFLKGFAWVAREAMWWWLVTLLLSLVMAWLLSSKAVLATRLDRLVLKTAPRLD